MCVRIYPRARIAVCLSGSITSTIFGESRCHKEISTSSFVFFFTNNSTVKAGLAKGNATTSCKLLELVLRFRLLQMKYRCQIMRSRVLSGKQMMTQGINGVSCRHLKEGVSTGGDTVHFIPLHLLDLQRSETMKD
jgi:hypothetical protein